MRQRGSIPIFLAAFLGVSLFAAHELSAGPIQYNVTDLGAASSGDLNNAGQVAFTLNVPIKMPVVGADGVTRQTKLYDSYGPNAGQISTMATSTARVFPVGKWPLYVGGIDAAGNVLLSNNTLVHDGSRWSTATTAWDRPRAP